MIRVIVSGNEISIKFRDFQWGFRQKLFSRGIMSRNFLEPSRRAPSTVMECMQ